MSQQLTGASPAAMLEVFAKFNPAQLSSRYLQWQNGHFQVEMHYGTVLEHLVIFGWLSHFA